MSCKLRTAGDLLRLQIPIHGDSGVDTADKYLKALKEAVSCKERPKAPSTTYAGIDGFAPPSNPWASQEHSSYVM